MSHVSTSLSSPPLRTFTLSKELIQTVTIARNCEFRHSHDLSTTSRNPARRYQSLDPKRSSSARDSQAITFANNLSRRFFSILSVRSTTQSKTQLVYMTSSSFWADQVNSVGWVKYPSYLLVKARYSVQTSSILAKTAGLNASGDLRMYISCVSSFARLE